MHRGAPARTAGLRVADARLRLASAVPKGLRCEYNAPWSGV